MRKKKKSVLIYVNPMVVREKVNHFNGAIEKKLIPLAATFNKVGFNVDIIVGEFDAPVVAHAGVFRLVHVISVKDLIETFGSPRNIEASLYADTKASNAQAMSSLLGRLNLEHPDLVLTWETPIPFFRDHFSCTPCLSLMPGFMSRLPFPELYTVDNEGLFRGGAGFSQAARILSDPPNLEASRLVDELRREVLPWIDRTNPFPRARLDPAGRFRNLLLLPLQVSDHFAFRVDSPFPDQMSMLLTVLNGIPSDTGLIVTQYTAGSSTDRILTSESLRVLSDAWPNLVYDPSFDKLDHVSQYLMASADAVVGFSSSLGMQARLWEKAFVSLGASHLAPFASHNSLNDWVNDSATIMVPENASPIMANILDRHHLLREKLIDPRFLAAWVGRFIDNPEQLPSAFEIEPEYRTAFISNVKLDRAREKIAQIFGGVPATDLDARFSALLKEMKPKVISFDIFDTLVERTVEQPVHVFKLVAARVFEVTGGAVTNFEQVRRESEKRVRAKVLEEQRRQEITLDEIYAHIADTFRLDVKTVEAIKALELEEELRCIVPREAGRALFEIARASGRRVILISDMYLPGDFILRLLDNCGYPVDTPLYLSSIFGLRKHEGDLFDAVQTHEKVAPKSWLHVGDNSSGDVAVPTSKGIRTFQLKSAFLNVAENKKVGPLLRPDRGNRSIAEAAIYGLMQRRFFNFNGVRVSNITHFGGDSVMLGYAGLGPVLFGYLDWVMKTARARGLDHVLFLSRDGKILWRMAEILYPKAEGWPAIDYVYASRRSMRIASLRTKADIVGMIASATQSTTVADYMWRKFNITINEADSVILENIGLQSETVISSRDAAHLTNLALALSDRILDMADRQRSALRHYFTRMGVTVERRAAIVDIGYSGSLQAGISSVTGCLSLEGFYYITFESARQWMPLTGPMFGYAGSLVNSRVHPDPICRNGFLYETLFCAPDDSFWGFEERDGRSQPVFDIVSEDGRRRQLIRQVHDGALLLARDLRAHFAHVIEQMDMPSTSAAQLLNDMIRNPSGLDAMLFSGCPFDDGFAGARTRYIVPTAEQIRRNPDCIKNAIWKEGAAVFARIPKVNNVQKVAPPRTRASADLRPKRSAQWLEGWIVGRFVSDDKKLLKYLKDRKAFFEDSSHPLVRAYSRLFVVT